MVKITNGVDIFEVTKGAYDSIYSRQGYKIVEKNEPIIEDEIPESNEKTEDEKFVEEVVAKPISQWNKDELKRFAALKDINISGVKNAGEAKAIIKDFIEADSQE